MIQKKKIPCGYTYYEMQLRELRELFTACGICDNCGEAMLSSDTVYLIPVLNMRTYCHKCFDKWSNRAEFFSEDIAFEKEQIQMIDKRIKTQSLSDS